MLGNYALQFFILALNSFFTFFNAKESISELGTFPKSVCSLCEQASYLCKTRFELVQSKKSFDTFFIELVLNLSKRGVQLVVSLLRCQDTIASYSFRLCVSMLIFDLVQALAFALQSNRKVCEVFVERKLGLYDLVRTAESLEFLIIFRSVFVSVCNLILMFIEALG